MNCFFRDYRRYDTIIIIRPTAVVSCVKNLRHPRSDKTHIFATIKLQSERVRQFRVRYKTRRGIIFTIACIRHTQIARAVKITATHERVYSMYCMHLII